MGERDERVILAFDFEEYGSREDALKRAQAVNLKPGDERKIFVIKEEMPWPEAQEK